MSSITDLVRPELPSLIELRHHLHAHPELSFREEATAAHLLNELQQIPGLDIRTGVAGTGIVATLAADREGPCVALRADMDALPIKEETGLPYASRNEGVMHACGHDGHMTCLVGAVRVLAKMVDKLPGPVRFLFQPAEEGGGGAKIMCNEGAMDDPPVAAAFALHGWPGLPIGKVGTRVGPMMASADSVNIEIIGQGTHAAQPQHGIDPIVVAAHVITALQTIVSRRLPPYESAVLTLAQISGGTARNVIPESVSIKGTLRTLDAAVREQAMKLIEEITTGTAAALGARAKVKIVVGYPVLSNDAALVDYFDRTVRAELGPDVQEEIPVSLGGEDFAFYGQHAPTVLWRHGVARPGEKTMIPLHNPKFDFADEAIESAVRLHCALALGFSAEAIKPA